MKKTKKTGASFSFGRLVDDFRQADPNDPGLWPLAPKVAVLLLIVCLSLGAAYGLVWKEQIETLEARQAEEQKLRDEWVAKKKQAVSLEEYRKQLAEIDRQFGALLKQLPNRSEMEALLVDINQAGRGRGLQFLYWKPGQEMVKDFYAELPIAIGLSGSYHDFGNFAGDVAKLPRIVTLRDLKVELNKDGALKMDVTAMTYRYLDEEEVAQQKREKTAKDVKNGKK